MWLLRLWSLPFVFAGALALCGALLGPSFGGGAGRSQRTARELSLYARAELLSYRHRLSGVAESLAQLDRLSPQFAPGGDGIDRGIEARLVEASQRLSLRLSLLSLEGEQLAGPPILDLPQLLESVDLRPIQLQAERATTGRGRRVELRWHPVDQRLVLLTPLIQDGLSVVIFSG